MSDQLSKNETSWILEVKLKLAMEVASSFDISTKIVVVHLEQTQTTHSWRVHTNEHP
jgi:hypothetical protein